MFIKETKMEALNKRKIVKLTVRTLDTIHIHCKIWSAHSVIAKGN